jgi:2-polyprenyl-6-methoxyphenol hydroxylase-like FAD-dependent oxidoreductase
LLEHVLKNLEQFPTRSLEAFLVADGGLPPMGDIAAKLVVIADGFDGVVRI